jgi:hypothetical protein
MNHLNVQKAEPLKKKEKKRGFWDRQAGRKRKGNDGGW